jgi:hypothetical protein
MLNYLDQDLPQVECLLESSATTTASNSERTTFDAKQLPNQGKHVLALCAVEA